MLVYFSLLFIIFILFYLIYSTRNFKNYERILEESGFQNERLSLLDKCTVPTLNTEQCYKSRFYECPIVNGSYQQCTNNYIPLPKYFNADCGNRTFDMVPYPQKISENCYYNGEGEETNGFLHVPSF